MWWRIFFGLLVAGTVRAQEIWTKIEGVDGRKVEVQVVSVDEEVVQARKRGGKEFAIKWERLSKRTQVELGKLVVSKEWLLTRYARRSEVPSDRKQRLALSKLRGGTLESELAIEWALDWLKKTQNEDGSWGAQYRVAMTGLALLCLSGHGETALSEKYGESYVKGVLYLIGVSTRQKGKLCSNINDKHWVYEHPIATEALCEALSGSQRERVPVPGLENACQNAAQWIVNSQHKSGGWEYSYSDDAPRGGDVSITSWQLCALGAAREAGLELRDLEKTLSKASKFVRSCRMTNGGFGYAGKIPLGDTESSSLAGAGMNSLRICLGEDSLEQRSAAEYILKETTFSWDWIDCNLYGLYYNARSMAERGGPEWLKFQEGWRDKVVRKQSEGGAWPELGKPTIELLKPASLSNRDAHFRTCMATMVLEEYCR